MVDGMTAATPTIARRYIVTCRHCKHTTAHDVETATRRVGKIVYGQRVVSTARYEPKPFRAPETCGGCGASRATGDYWAKVAQVHGHHNPDIKCDARCQGAHGPNCDCSCGSANHGRAYLGVEGEGT